MKNNHRWTQEEAALLVELWQGPTPVSEIAGRFGIKVGAARAFAAWLRRKGVPLRKRYSGRMKLIDFAALKAIIAQENRQ